MLFAALPEQCCVSGTRTGSSCAVADGSCACCTGHQDCWAGYGVHHQAAGVCIDWQSTLCVLSLQITQCSSAAHHVVRCHCTAPPHSTLVCSMLGHSHNRRQSKSRQGDGAPVCTGWIWSAAKVMGCILVGVVGWSWIASRWALLQGFGQVHAVVVLVPSGDACIVPGMHALR